MGSPDPALEVDKVLSDHQAEESAGAGVRTARNPHGAGRPKGAKTRRAPAPEPVAPVPAVIFTPESVQPVVQLPFGVLNIAFSTDSFDLEDVETVNLCNQTATCLNLFAPNWNPKWAACTALALGFLVVMTRKTLDLLAERRRLRDEARNEARKAKEAQTE